MPQDKVDVLFVGLQSGFGFCPDWYMVNLPNGSTVRFNPDRHRITGPVKPGIVVPEELLGE